MNIRIIKTTLINFLHIYIILIISGLVLTLVRKNTPLFRVNEEIIKKDLEKSKDNTFENTGWPSKEFASVNLSSQQYRKFKIKPKDSCMEVYGGSYVYSFNSNTVEDSWTYTLSNKINCPVLNYGIPGFGSDQAMLRHKKYQSYQNQSILLFIDDSLERNMYPMLSLSYKGLARGYNNKTFKPFFNLNNKLNLIDSNSYDTFNSIKNIRNEICMGPFSIFCILERTSDNIKKSIITRGQLYQSIANYSEIIAEFLAKNLIEKKDKSLEKKLDLQIALLNKYLENCAYVNQKCFIARFPYLRDVAYPERVLTNPIEISIKKNFKNEYLDSYHTGVCMKSILGKKNYTKKIDTSVMKYEHKRNKHYLREANDAFAYCLYNSLEQKGLKINKNN